MNHQLEPECPECNRALKIRNKSQLIGEFIDWLRKEKRMNFNMDTEKLLAEFFGIDLGKVENEKRSILDFIRKQ